VLKYSLKELRAKTVAQAVKAPRSLKRFVMNLARKGFFY